MQCLVTNAKRVIDLTLSGLPLPDVQEHSNQLEAQVKAQANYMPISEEIWPQKPEIKDLGVIEYQR